MANIGSLIAHLGVDTSGLRSAAQDFKQFETTTSTGLSNMTKGVVALAAAFASLKMVQGGKDAVMFAASVEQADVALRSISNSMGVAADKAIKYRDSLRDVNITTSSATNATAQFIRMGLPIEKLNQLGTAAQGAAINYKMMTGETISSSEALDKMVHAIATGQNIVLHNLGIMTSMKDIYRENRQETGLASNAIDSHKRHLLVLDDVLEKTVPLMNLYKDSTGLATKNISSSKRPLEEMKLALGNLFLPELTAASLAFYNTVSSGQKWVKSHTVELEAATAMIKDFSDGVVFAAGVLGTYVVAMGLATAATGGFAAGAGMFSGVLATMRMQLSLTGATATVMATQINSMGVSVAVAMQTATVSVLSLKAAMAVLGGFMIGWEIGKFWATFESGAKAGVVVVHGLVKAWDYASEAAERFWIVAKGSATTWAGTMAALDAVGKKYDALAKSRSAAFGESWDAAKGGVPDVATKEWKEDPALVAANATRIAAEQAEAAALAGAQAAKKLAEQWAKTKKGLEQELKLEGLTGLEKTLQEITNRADELRATAGTDKAWVKQWEEQTKAAATYRDEIEHLGKQYELFAENQVELKRIKEDYDSLVTDMLPAEARAVALVAKEYEKKREVAEMALASGQDSAEGVAATMARINANEADARTKAIDDIHDKSDTTKKIWENMYQSLQSITADWLENMKISWSSLGTLFKKFVAQMVSAWAWGQASMAWGGTSGTPGGSTGGLSLSSMGTGLAAIGGAAAVGSMVSGPNTTNEALTSAGIGTAGIALEAYTSTGGQLSSTLLGSIQDRTAEYVSTNLSAELGAGISDLSSAAFSGWAAGIGTFVISLIRGESFKAAAFKGVGAGLGAWGGFTLGATYGGTYGSYLGPIGAVVGAALGALIGGLFAGGGKENSFTLTELVPSMTTAFDKETGMTPSGWQHPSGGNEWYHGIANAYSDVIGTIQEDFNKNLFAFANELPETMRGLLLDNLAATDFSAITSEASGGRWGVSGAQGALEGVAQRYADGLAKAVNDAYKAALVTFVQTSDPSELLGADLQGTWSVLNAAAQAQVKAMFEAAGTAMANGGLEAGVAEMNKITDELNKIKAATDPIQEIIDTNGLSEYELAIRSINKEFDSYASALEDAGVDLSKYTQLEEARTISLAKAATETSRLTQAMKDYVNAAEDDLRTAFDTEKSRLADRQATLEKNLQSAEGLLRRSFAAEIERIGTATQTLIDGLNTRLQTSQQTISTLGQAVSKLTSAADSMVGAGSRAGILAAISGIQGITGAVRGGDVAALDSVDKYLSIVTGDNAQYYASFDEYQRDFLKAKIAIMDLNAVAGDTLSTEEQMARLLQTQIDLAQSSADQQIVSLNSQLDTLLGVDASIVGLSQAITEFTASQTELDTFGYETQIGLLDAQLNALLKIDTSVLSLGEATAQYKQAQAAVSTASSSAALGGFNPSDPSSLPGTVAQMYEAALGREADPAGLVYWSTQLALAGGNVNAIKDAFFTSAEGYGENVTRSFAVGTDYVPYDMTAKIHQGERITPAAYNRSDSTNADLLAELRMMRKDNEAMRAELLDIKRSNKRIMDITEKSDSIGPAPARATA